MMKKYNYYFVLFLMLIFDSAQATVYPNFSQMMTNTDYVVNPGITGSGGRIWITNDVLTVNIGGSWSIAQNLKLGTIRTLAISPVLPNLEIGELKTQAGNPTGYFLKIENNNVIIYTVGTPALLTGFNLSVTIGLVRTWYLDNDLDGLGDPLNAVVQYNKPAGNYVLDNTDNCPSIPGTNVSCTVLETGLLNQSFIKNTTYKIPTSTTIVNPSIAQASQNKTFFDGLGRPIQQIALAQSGSGNDIITQMDYDVYGRMPKDFLPYATTSSSINYRIDARTQLNTFYKTDNYENTTNPYSEKDFENSPLNRVLKQAAPGSSWAMGNGHEIKLDYQTNTAGEVTLFTANTIWNSTQGIYETALVSGVYWANQLIKNVTYDENTTAIPAEVNGSTVEFKNREGQVVLKRTYGTVGTGTTNEKHDTYYVYDVYGNLTYVIPPKATDLIGTATGLQADITSSAVVPAGTSLPLMASNSIRLLPGFQFKAQAGATFSAVIDNGNQTILDNLCYQYKYDYRNRMVEKKLPGKQWEFIVYDKLDRVVATGPANSPFSDLTSVGWLVTKYDAFNRPVLTAWLPATVTNATRNTLQGTQNTTTANFSETKTATATNTTIKGVDFRYSTVAWPTADYHVLMVNYYDDYNFPNAPVMETSVANGDQLVYYNNTTQKPKGLPTATWIRVPDASTDYKNEQTYTFYDEKARPVRSYTKNFLGGYTCTDSKLDSFSGQLQYSITKHKRSPLASDLEIITKDAFTYTPQDRLLTQTHQIGTATTSEVIVNNSYDELGQLISKKVGNTIAAPTQKVDYTYNIRGWMTGINNTAALQQGSDPKDLFAFKINYNNTPGITGGKALYNGNIAETFWISTSETTPVIRGYAYLYDNLNRLKTSIYKRDAVISNTIISNAYSENLTYDKNGNIGSLTRNGNSETATQIDALVYTYTNNNTTNQLLKVVDSAPAATKIYGFTDSAANTDDYSYDANGNMTKDNNKNITAITYNQLNLPTKITFATTGNIVYIYNAAGQKVQKIVKEGVNETITDYLAGYQYVKTPATNTMLKFFPTAEGYVEVSGSSYKYVYQYKDHLGNIRLSYDKNLTIQDENQYYPFGLQQKRPTDVIVASNYKYNYNGKELQDELELGMYTYGFRDYDPAIGRWICIDPLAEKTRRWSTYNFCFDNPVRFIDPDGREITNIEGGVRFTGNDAKLFYKVIQNQVKENGGIKGFHFVMQSKTSQIYNDLLSAFRAGKPNVLHIIKDNPKLKNDNRNDAIGSYPNRKKEGLERQEYPYASTYEGGEGAYVTYVPEKEQRIEGGQLSVLSRSLKDKDAFLVIPVPAEKERDVVPYSLPVYYPSPAPSSDLLEKGVKPAVTTATILIILGMIILSPIGI